MKKLVLFTVMILPALWLAGCSDYPSDGIVDTRVIREKADIEEITGAVYGIKKGAVEAIGNIQADYDVAYNIDDKIWETIKQNGPDAELPALALTYKDADTSALQSGYEALVAKAKTDYKEGVTDQNYRVGVLQEKLDEATATLEKLNADQAGYNADIAASDEKLKAVNERLEAEKAKYNAVFASAIEQTTALAKQHGVNGTYSDTMIGRYRSIDFTNRNTVPENCPDQKGYFAVDVRDINNQCAYLAVPRNLQGTEAESGVKVIIAKSFKEFLTQSSILGNKPSWSQKATGVYAEVAAAQEALKNAKNAAEQKYGRSNNRDYQMSSATRAVEQLTARIKEESAKDYLTGYILSSYLSTPDEYDDAKKNYFKALQKDFAENYIEKAADITLSNDNNVPVGSFSDIDSGFTHLVAVTDILASTQYKKDVLRSVDVLSTEDPLVIDADALEFSASKDNISDRGSNTTEEKRIEAVIENFGRAITE